MTAVTLENILRATQRENLHSIILHLEKYTSTLLSSSAFAPQLSRSYKPQPTSPLDADTKPGETNANKYLVQHRDLLSSEAQTGWEYRVVLGTNRREPRSWETQTVDLLLLHTLSTRQWCPINNCVCVCVCVCCVFCWCYRYCVVCWSVLSRRLGHSPPVTPQGENLTGQNRRSISTPGSTQTL